MPIARDERMPIASGEDIVKVRQRVRACAVAIGFSIVEQTKLVTAASELARNTLVHGLGGEMTIETLDDHGRRGLRLTFSDHGPGIADVARAMTDGFTTAGGLGLGLGGAKRLVNEFQIVSAPGQGTSVSIVRWSAGR